MVYRIMLLVALASLSSPAAGGESQDLCALEASADDGTVDSGYGFVPSATDGIYLQAFERRQFAHPYLATVCVCWLKTRGDRDIDFDVVLYEEVGGLPGPSPALTIPARATMVADKVEHAGKLVAVNVGSYPLPQSRFFLGVSWNPKQESFLFVCNDQSPESPVTQVYYRDDRSRRWQNALHTSDPLFTKHRSILVRAQSAPSVSVTPLASPASAPPSIR